MSCVECCACIVLFGTRHARPGAVAYECCCLRKHRVWSAWKQTPSVAAGVHGPAPSESNALGGTPDSAVLATHAHADPTVHARTSSMPAAQVVAADVLSFNQIQHELQARQASVSKSEAREQAAIIQ